MRVEQLLQRAAGRYPDKIAVVCGGQRYSYGWIEDESTRCAESLVTGGVKAGDRVAIVLDNSIETIVWLFAVLKARAAFFIVQTQVRPARLNALMADSDAAAVIARGPSGCVDIAWRGSRAAKARAACPDADPELAALVYTSGSTGVPKGVMLTHDNLTMAAASIAGYLENTPQDVVLNVLPLAFTYGLGQVTTVFSVGATVLLEASFTYARDVIARAAREGVTGIPMVPTMATVFLQQHLRSEHLPTLRYITNAAAALSMSKIRGLRAALPGVSIYSMYGLTECQRATFLRPELVDLHPDSVGTAIPGTEVALVDERGNDAPPGAVGELIVRGPHVMKGYWNQPGATAAALRPRGPSGETWLHTGDLFRRDQNGLLYFVERRDAIIKTKGEKVAPREVEEIIARLAEVEEVAVFGMPDPLLGEAIAAVVTPRAGCSLTAADIQRHCRAHLESYMVPRIVRFETTMPKTTTGKISRRELRESAIGIGVAG